MAHRAIEHLPIFVIYYRSRLVNSEVYEPLVKPRVARASRVALRRAVDEISFLDSRS